MNSDWRIDTAHIKFIYKKCGLFFSQHRNLIPFDLKLASESSSLQTITNNCNILSFNINIRNNKSINEVLLKLNLPIISTDIILEYADLKEIINLLLWCDTSEAVPTYNMNMVFFDNLIITDSFSYLHPLECHWDFPNNYSEYFNLKFKNHLNLLQKTRSVEHINTVTEIFCTICYTVDTIMHRLFEKQ